MFALKSEYLYHFKDMHIIRSLFQKTWPAAPREPQRTRITTHRQSRPKQEDKGGERSRRVTLREATLCCYNITGGEGSSTSLSSGPVSLFDTFNITAFYSPSALTEFCLDTEEAANLNSDSISIWVLNWLMFQLRCSHPHRSSHSDSLISDH